MPVGSQPTAGADRRVAYQVLVGVQLLGAAFALAFALFPSGGDALRRYDAVAAALLGLGALLTWFVAPRLPHDLGMDVVLVVIAAIAMVGTILVPDPAALVLVGYGFVLVATFAAYFRPRRRYARHMVFLLVGFVLAVHLNPIVVPLMDILVVLIITGMVSGTVSVLARRLREQTLQDPLTGALNRRGLDATAPALLANAARAGQPVSVGVIDLDSFHAYNQVHGHVAGDELLVRVAAAWEERLRAGDLLVRYGGDEFVVLLPGTRYDEARRVAARIRAHNPAPWTVGFVEWIPGEGLYDVIERADAEMYRHKPGHRRLSSDGLASPDRPLGV